jgi:hypothetical protein
MIRSILLITIIAMAIIVCGLSISFLILGGKKNVR